MVETASIYTHKILRQLEKFLILKNGFNLLGETYELILLIPSDKYSTDTKYSLIISAKSLNNFQQKDIIKEIFTAFKETLEIDEFNSISRINVIHTHDSFVRNLKLMFGLREEIIELNNITVGGANIDFAYLIRSLVLDKLIAGRALNLEIIDPDGNLGHISAGIKGIDNSFNVVYYTGKGLREIFGLEKTKSEEDDAEILKNMNEQYLISNHLIAKIRFDDINKVM